MRSLLPMEKPSSNDTPPMKNHAFFPGLIPRTHGQFRVSLPIVDSITPRKGKV